MKDEELRPLIAAMILGGKLANPNPEGCYGGGSDSINVSSAIEITDMLLAALKQRRATGG